MLCFLLANDFVDFKVVINLSRGFDDNLKTAAIATSATTITLLKI
jgi:hypothetical protein